jgi:nitrile hydratase
MSYHSHADLGGRYGHGPVRPEPEGELFHAAWEPQALALTLAMGATGAWNIDMVRSARETLTDYARSSYYAIWIKALEILLLERGLVQPAELAAGRMLAAPRAQPRALRVLRADQVAEVLRRGAPTLRPATTPARFAINDRVRTRREPGAHHTRLPGYARGRRGRIERLHGMHVFADANAQGLGEQPQWLYNVVFASSELWGEDGTEGPTVSIDAWEPYLEPDT